MEIIKEKCINKKYKSIRIIIRTNCYISNFNHFIMLKEILDKDFPGIKFDPEIIQYGGRYYKGTFGFEFSVPVGTSIPKEYQEIGQVEYKL